MKTLFLHNSIGRLPWRAVTGSRPGVFGWRISPVGAVVGIPIVRIPVPRIIPTNTDNRYYGYPYGSYYGSYYGGTDYGNGYSTGSRVAELQRRLAQGGYYSGAIDGIMGPATRRAIRAYARDRGY